MPPGRFADRVFLFGADGNVPSSLKTQASLRTPKKSPKNPVRKTRIHCVSIKYYGLHETSSADAALALETFRVIRGEVLRPESAEPAAEIVKDFAGRVVAGCPHNSPAGMRSGSAEIEIPYRRDRKSVV